MTSRRLPEDRVSAVRRDEGFALRLLEQMAVPTFVLDRAGRVVIWNRACETLTGVPADRLIGTTDHWQAFYDKPTPCLADLLLQDRLEEVGTLHPGWTPRERSESGVSAEVSCHCRGVGRRVHLLVDATPILDGQGRLIAVAETIRDVTTQKIAQEELQSLAAIDGLTGLANRRRFDLQIEAEIDKAVGLGQPLSLMMLDVDAFKAFNDTYGHQAGDACLRAVAKELRWALRPQDLPARYGGEEFAAILPDTGLEEAAAIAERVRAAVAALEIPHERSAAGPFVTVSLGLAATRGRDIRGLVAAADEALYASKRAGRNRISTAERPAALTLF